ncbi:phage major capsid protein [Nocardia terpenica]|uniref:phage major capsid protein n=1 Tax=Nocardia terpenica TaxID=455432 RepID=UPI0018949C8A|nr:phage major capsid protein [Nocardia terpenica]MBF6060515.1 phage major capsid protein [Nocardia terpenica]MBF6103775.1 phage major capsid protein [Nocardia terpenica]MBF6111851.1 phage major capsid protein [Nocardia terpenica]MBF6117996.1 phage major capsid protein [Nocardia terpenica]MBF6155278.1 phage major capsid protein [Nocardia terpenica]
MATIATLKARGHQLREEFTTIQADTTLTAAERADKLDKLVQDVSDHETELKNAQRTRELSAKLGRGEAGTDDEQMPAGTGYKSMAQRIMEHPDFLDAVDAVQKEARRTVSKAFEIGLKDATPAANLLGESILGATGPTPLGQNVFFPTGAAAAVLPPTWIPGVVEQRFFPLQLTDVIPSSAITTNNLSYVVESMFTNNAAETPEAGEYPYSSVKLDRVYEQLGKITNALKLTDETIADSAMFHNFASGRLVLGVQRKEEVALLAGQGGGQGNINGLLNRSSGFTKAPGFTPVTVNNVAFPPTGTPGAGTAPEVMPTVTYGRQVKGDAAGAYPAAGAIAESLFFGTTDVWLNSWIAPTHYILNPLDWQVIRLGKDRQGEYYGPSFFGASYGVQQPAPDSLWGKPVIVTPAIPQGTALVASLTREVLEAFRRQGISVEMTNANGNDFDHGLWSVRAQMRTGLAVYRPAAFQLVQIISG